VGLDSLGTLTTFSGALTTGIAEGHPIDAPFLFPTISASEVQVSMPAGMRAERWSLADGTGRLIAARVLQRGERWFTLDASSLAPGSYVLLINERPADTAPPAGAAARCAALCAMDRAVPHRPERPGHGRPASAGP
jgi:hypothetical protein